MCRVDTMGRDRETVSDSEKRLSPTVSVGDLCEQTGWRQKYQKACAAVSA